MNEKHTILRGHDSFETAYIIADYPYGFRLRCKQAVWLEFKAGWGSRYCTRTTNPKVPGEIWNAPKKGTYYSGMTFRNRERQFERTHFASRLWRLDEYKTTRRIRGRMGPAT